MRPTERKKRQMTLFELDDDFYHHPKVIMSGPLGIAMYVAAACYCSEHGSRGFIPNDAILGLLDLWSINLSSDKVIAVLINSGLWQEVDGGYLIDLSFCRIKFWVSTRQAWDTIRQWMTPVVIKRDGAVCRKCGSINDLTIDHIMPLSNGGTNDIKNLQVLCRSCNSKKGTKCPG